MRESVCRDNSFRLEFVESVYDALCGINKRVQN